MSSFFVCCHETITLKKQIFTPTVRLKNPYEQTVFKEQILYKLAYTLQCALRDTLRTTTTEHDLKQTRGATPHRLVKAGIYLTHRITYLFISTINTADWKLRQLSLRGADIHFTVEPSRGSTSPKSRTRQCVGLNTGPALNN